MDENNDVKAYIEEMKKRLENTNINNEVEKTTLVFGENEHTNIEGKEGIGDIQNGAINGAGEVGSPEFKVAGLPHTTCSVCHTNKVRLRKKTPKKSSRQYYENEKGEAWVGRKCPSCHQKDAREMMRRKRATKI